MKSRLLFVSCILLSCALSAQERSKDNAFSQRLFTTIDLGTTPQFSNQKPQITLTLKDQTGETLWLNTYGGRSWERAGDVVPTQDGGFLILGSTSSYGKGNYDFFVVKTDSEGGEMWTNVYGDFYNEYGEAIEFVPNGNFLLIGTKQICTGEKNDFSKCKDYKWQLEIDQDGQVVRDEVGAAVIRR